MSFSRRYRVLPWSLISCSLASLAFAGIENRPLNSDEATVLEKNQGVLCLGISRIVQPNGDREWNSVADLEYGIFKDLEFDLEIPYRRLDLSDSRKSRVTGIGDLTTWTEWNYLKGEGYWLSTAFSWKTRSGSQNQGLGTGEDNYTLLALASKQWGKAAVHLNLGYTVVDRRMETDYRNAWYYNLAASYVVNERLSLLGEIYEQVVHPLTERPLSTNAPIGLALNVSKTLTYDAGIAKGWNNTSPAWFLTTGLTWSF